MQTLGQVKVSLAAKRARKMGNETVDQMARVTKVSYLAARVLIVSVICESHDTAYPSQLVASQLRVSCLAIPCHAVVSMLQRSFPMPYRAKVQRHAAFCVLIITTVQAMHPATQRSRPPPPTPRPNAPASRFRHGHPEWTSRG